MTLLVPKCPSRFEKKSFWDEAYESSDNSFEWYATFDELLPLLTKYIRNTDEILNVGCGSSDFGAVLCTSGWSSVINIDISDKVITKMKSQYPDGNYQQMDATKMTFRDDTFDVVIDKGTVDALAPSASSMTSEEGWSTVKQVLSESLRVLKPGGRLLIISLAQRQVVNVIQSFVEQVASCNCLVRTHHLPPNGKSTSYFALPVFVFMLMKMKIKRSCPIFEFQTRAGTNFDVCTRLENGSAWRSGILSHQIIQFNVRTANKRFPPRAKPSEHFDVTLEIESSENTVIGGFRLFIVDKPVPVAMKFAVFVVPCGREIDELYSTVAGRNRLADAVSAGRLLICCMIPRKVATKEKSKSDLSLDDVTSLLDDIVIQLAPPLFQTGKDKAPYLAEAISGAGNSSPKDQKLGSSSTIVSTKPLRIVLIESGSKTSCSTVDSKKRKSGKKAQSNEVKAFKTVTESETNHISCISQVCVNHACKTTRWTCHQLPSDCELLDVFNSFEKDPLLVLQVGDDCHNLFKRVACSIESRRSFLDSCWKTFCLAGETAGEDVKKEMTTAVDISSTPCYFLSSENVLSFLSEKNGVSRKFDVLVVMLSCVFIGSLEILIENMSTWLAENCKIVAIKCCREPSTDLMACATQLNELSSVKKNKANLIELDTTDTFCD